MGIILVYLSWYKYRLVTWWNSIRPKGLYGEFDHIPTGIYIKIIRYYLYLHLWSITIPSFKKMFKKTPTKWWNLTLCHYLLLYCDVAIGIYEVIDTHCSSQCYVGGNSCECKYSSLDGMYYGTAMSVHSWFSILNNCISLPHIKLRLAL
jgi:hypothetical protein